MAVFAGKTSADRLRKRSGVSGESFAESRGCDVSGMAFLL